jgi:heavy metal sensor kinase
MSRLPIRLRLSLWYMSLTALVLLIFSYAVYTGLEGRLARNLDEELRSKAQLAASSITFGQGNAIRDAIRRNELSEERLMRLYGFDGTILLQADAEGLETYQVNVSHLLRAQRGQISLETLTFNGETVRMIVVPVRGFNAQTQTQENLYAFQMAYSTERVEDALNFLIQALLLIAPLAIVLSALTGYILAGRALQPVSEITRLASQIDADELGSRLDLDLPDDELGRLARTFNLMLERIDLGFQRQRQFTGDAAHELRTPLALMRSQIDLAMTQAESTAEYREALAALDGDVGRMTSLVSTLLSLARADAGGLVPNREPTDLAELVRDVAEQLDTIAAEHDLRISTVTQPVTASIDTDMIIQVLVNLVDNAIKNTPAGGRITITASLTSDGVPDANGAMARISVADTGVGIAPEHLPHIFDRFYRVDHGRARSRGGTGLGLAICQAIVHAHNGQITAASEEGKGSTFTLTLPLGDV